jgi:hypothetical protein
MCNAHTSRQPLVCDLKDCVLAWNSYPSSGKASVRPGFQQEICTASTMLYTIRLSLLHHLYCLYCRVGILTVPSAFDRLGWATSLICLVAFGGALWYSGVLYSRLMTAFPGISTWHDVSAAFIVLIPSFLITVPVLYSTASTMLLDHCATEIPNTA